MPMPNGTYSRVMIDCGHNIRVGQRWYPGERLAEAGVNHVDLLVITNYDDDHASGFPDLLKHGITFGCLLGNPSVPPETIAHLKTDDGMGPGISAVATALALRRQRDWVETVPHNIPNVEMAWTWNVYPAFTDENNLSLVFVLAIHGYVFMFPGDLERAGWKFMLEKSEQLRRHVKIVDVLIAAHHGRDNGIYEELFTTYNCKPKLVVISDDYKQYDTQNTTNFYGSKVSGIGPFRNEARRRVLTTRKDGHLSFMFKDGGCNVV